MITVGRGKHHIMKHLTFVENLIFYILLLLALFLILKAIPGESGTIFRSKHDLSYLSQRAIAKGGVGAMNGVTYNDYGEVCVYCHTPHGSNDVAPLWNHALPSASGYSMYRSTTIDASMPSAPDGVSLACLSCHDGTVAVDSITNPPNTTWVDTGVHYRMSAETSGESCGKCHTPQGELSGLYGAHDATVKYLTKNLADDHPVSMSYPTVLQDPKFNIPPGTGIFPNGIRLFSGKVQCASCHDPHNPDEQNLEGRDPFLRTSKRDSSLCMTCHIK